MVNNSFGERLQLAMKLRNKRVSDVALNCNIDKSNLVKYINGTYPMPKQSTIEKLANYLCVSPLYLMGYQTNLTSYEVKTHQHLSPSDDDLQRQALMNEIDSLCSYASLETLKTLRVLITTICKSEEAK